MDLEREKLLQETYDKFLDVGFGSTSSTDEFDEITLSDIMGFGTAVDEYIFSRSDLKEMIQRQRDQVEGLELGWSSKPIKRWLAKDDNTALFIDDIILEINLEAERIKMPLRFSTILEFQIDQWKVVHFHGSKPENVESEKDTWGIEDLKDKNAKLEKLVAEKTFDLEIKNKELAIEASLERVRAVAMGMQNPEDMLDVCRVISDQLQDFGVEKIRNVQTAIIEEQKGHYLCYQYFPAYDKTSIEVTEYRKNPVEQEMVKQMLTSRNGHFIGKIHGKELMDFSSHRKEENHFPDPQLDQASELSYCFLSIGEGGLGLSLYQNLEPQVVTLFKRFHQVFSLAFQRFRDIQKAESQARKAEIELALERVRARTMAMQRSDELIETSELLFEQIKNLNIELWSCGFSLWYDDDSYFEGYNTGPDGKMGDPLKIPLTEDVFFKTIREAKRRGEGFLIFESGGESLVETYRYMNTLPVVGDFMRGIVEAGFPLPTYQVTHCGFFSQGHLMFITRQANPEAVDIFKRFTKVFDQTYTRFLDLQKAENQAREAQIEAALEKVRSHTMAMQKSEDLNEAASAMFRQIQSLGIQPWGCGFNIFDKDEKTVTQYMSLADGGISPPFRTPLTEDPFFKRIKEARELGDDLLVMESKGESLASTYRYMFSLPGSREIFGDLEKSGFEMPKFQITHCAYFSQGYLVFITYEQAADAHDIFKRFAKVFEQTYTRFLDLQKAEGQAREAQIEAALERVRSRSLAMHKSEELTEVAKELFDQLRSLGGDLWGSGIGLCSSDREIDDFWFANEQGIMPLVSIPHTEDPTHRAMFKHWQEKHTSFSIVAKGQALEEHYQYMLSVPSVKPFFQGILNAGLKFPTWQQWNCAYFSKGYILLITHKPYQEIDILIRFAKAFEQAYTRFLDLQKAEAQAREAQIESSLERVRSRTMAMQSSGELSDAAQVLFEQLNLLGVTHERINIGIVNEPNQTIDFWVTDQGGKKLNTKFSGRISEPTTLSKAYAAWKSNKKSLVIDLQGEELASWLKFMTEEIKIPFDTAYLHDRRVQTAGFFSKGILVVTSPEPLEDEALYLLEKFASVFDLTYTRFSDLKHAEAQARKAQIEVALERVRARALAMQNPEELVEVANVMREEMGTLGVEELETSSIYINSENGEDAQCWYSLKDIRDGKKTFVADHFNLNYTKTWVGREMISFYRSERTDTSILMQGKNRKEWINYCSEQSPVFQGYYGEVIPERTYHLSKFSHGAIGAATPGEISPESWELLRRAASVFSLAYSRFRDLSKAREDLKQLKKAKSKAEKALKELREAQEQLIQQEKLASLGQLTAGIAHEIKNPLNFVNNFSDLSRELIDEVMEEFVNIEDSESKLEILAILQDVKSNLSKVHEHGTRADSIVKSMLQHSRGSGGKMEAIDPNHLLREFSNLAFHGMRAGKNPINVDLNFNLDPDAGRVNLVMEDFSRVILNICNNAFDAMRDKFNSCDDSNYLPKLTIQTKREKHKLIMAFQDNGPGIPKAIEDKILQPFFTTKKGTEGTGLGLSITHDIIKAHGGELKIESSGGQGSVFYILLPVRVDF